MFNFDHFLIESHFRITIESKQTIQTQGDQMVSPAVTTGVHAGLDHNSTVVVTVLSLIICGVVYAICKPLSTHLEARYVYCRRLLLLPPNPKTAETA